jgi:hypothetical protein
MLADVLRPSDKRYKVVAGDCLWTIAAREYGDPLVWHEISSANHLPKSHLLLVGMWLDLPTIHRPSLHTKSHRPPTSAVERHEAVAKSLQPWTPPSLPTTAPKGGARVPQPTGKSATHLHATRGSQLNRGGHRPAIPVLYPAVKYTLDDSPPLIVTTPIADFKLRFTGEVSLGKTGTMSEVELGHSGTLSEKLQTEYKSKLTDLAGQIKIGFNPHTREVEVSCGFSVAAKINGQVFATSQYDFIPPNRLKYSYTPKPIEGESGGTEFKGSVGFELEVTLKKPGDSPPPAEPAPVPAHRGVPTWQWVAAGGLVVVGAAIIFGDTLKDIATLGLGFFESPISYAAAGALFKEASTLIH